MAPKVKESKESKAASSSTKPARKEKKTKDPNAPKKPLSAYMFFCQASRDTIKTENPDAGFGTCREVIHLSDFLSRLTRFLLI